MSHLENLNQAINNGQYAAAEESAQAVLDSGSSADELIEAIMTTLDGVGQRFSAGEVFIPEMMVSAKTAQKAIDVLAPVLTGNERKPLGQVVIGTVKGDLHDLGKNIVTLMLRGAGFEVFDLGTDVSPDMFIGAIKEHKPQVLALSCLISTTMKSLPLTIEAIEEAGIRDQVKIMIGGPPTSDVYAHKIGADYYGKDAQIGVEIAKKVIQANN